MSNCCNSCTPANVRDALIYTEKAKSQGGSGSYAAGQLIVDEITINCTSVETNGIARIKEVTLTEEHATDSQNKSFTLIVGRDTFGGLVAGNAFAMGANSNKDIKVYNVASSAFIQLTTLIGQASAVNIDLHLDTTLNANTLYAVVIAAETYAYNASTFDISLITQKS